MENTLAKKHAEDTIRDLYLRFQHMLDDGADVKDVVEVLSKMYLVLPPKIIVSDEEFRKKCLAIGVDGGEGGYFEEPDTLILHSRSSRYLALVLHEFLHYVDFQLMQAIDPQYREPLEHRAEELAREKCERLARLYS